ncbi:MAG: site-specific DNA-methyltransferase [Bacteroidales bacterium]
MADFVNQLILGDNLEVLKSLPKESVDLIYIDPPFFSNRNYEVIWGDEGEVRSFKDRWSGGIDHYISWLKERIAEMYRVLKPTGSMFVHCDWHANSYIRVEILDKFFGYQNFKGEIIWKRVNAHNDAVKKLAVLTDTIWYYSKSENSSYNPIYSEHDESYVDKFYNLNDNDGKGLYQLTDISSPNPRPNMMYEWLGFPCPDKGWRYQKDTMQKLHDEGRIYYPKNKDGGFDYSKRPRLKRYIEEQKGMLLGNIWIDLQNVQAHAKERIGYPTQKPNELLERIIKMSSNENDIVLDAFVGGGTTCAVADKLNRRWIGIDSSVSAIKVSEFRLNQQQDLFSKPFIVKLHKYDYDTLRYKDAFEFESWIIEQYGGIPNTKKRGDFGMDGITKENLPIQVKRSDNIGRNVIDNFHSAVQRYDKALYDENKDANIPIGYIIAFSFGKGAIEEVARLKVRDGVIIVLVKVEDIVPLAKKPKLTVNLSDLGRDKKGIREIEFHAFGESPAGIEFYAWDWDYDPQKGFKPEVLIDKEGKQAFKFKPGIHQIAVKVVDMEGMDNTEIIKLKVNGEIEKM